MRPFALLALLLIPLCEPVAAQPSAAPSPMTTTTSAPSVIWPPLEGWRTETIHFPLDFAPTLDYTGYEELRFSPEFGKSDRPLFFTYAFLWVVPETTVLDKERLQRDLKTYFDGLMRAVAKDKKLEVATLDTKVVVTDAPPGPDQFTFLAQIETFDAFFTKAPLKLEMHVIRNVKQLDHWRAHYFEATTSPLQQQVLPELQKARAALQQ